jgi:hypothetical protein
MSQAKEIYWLCRSMSADVTQKIQLLQRYHITVRTVSDFQSLAKAYAESRLNTIIIGDEGDPSTLDGPMVKLSNHPEYAGVRFILSLSRSNGDLVTKVVNLGFRDIIAIDLPDAQWLKRYAFASSGRPTELSLPNPRISLQSLASLKIPGRVAWVTEKELWLETRLAPPVGTELPMSGGLADLLGLKQVRLKVLNRYRSHLHFRYSEALLCRWEVAPQHQVRKLALQNFMNEQGSAAQYRLYAIIKNRELRNYLVKTLPDDRFQLSVALNKNNMIQEPRFIAPDAVLIEDKMCLGPHRLNFEEMLKNLDPQISVFVMGEAASTVTSALGHRLIAVEDVRTHFQNFVETELGAPKAVNLDATPVPRNHALSFADILLPARLTSVHPEFIEIASTYSLGQFGLFGLESPLFQSAVQQKVHGKVLDTYEGETQGQLKEFPYRARAIITDLARSEREALGRQLVEVFRRQMLPKAPDSQPAVGRTEAPPLAESAIDLKAAAVRPVASLGLEIAPILDASIPEVLGAGPMKTELARSLRDIEAEPFPALSSVETEVRPLAEQILIDRNYKESVVANAFEAMAEALFNIPREIKIAAFVALGIGIALWIAVYWRQPLEEQGVVFTEQLKKYQEQHGGRLVPPRDSGETFEP